MLAWLLNLGFAGGQSVNTNSARLVVRYRAATSIVVRQAPATRITWRSTMSILHVGDTNDIEVEFRVKNATTGVWELTDPSAVSIRVQRRVTGSAATTYTYGTDSNVTRLSLGIFRARIDCTAAGTWDFVWVSPGPTAKGVEAGWFEVFATI